jgi:hypothetical protein
MRYSRIKTYLLVAVLAVICYFGLQYILLQSTENVPLQNLQHSRCLIQFDILYQGKVFHVLATTGDTYDLTKVSKPVLTVGLFFDLYFNEVIKRGLLVKADDELYSNFRPYLVPDSLISKHAGAVNEFHDHVPLSIKREDRIAIFYVLLKAGVNCCVDDETGTYDIGPKKDAHIIPKEFLQK